jgi:hypothetical protein
MKLWVIKQVAQARYDICKTCEKFDETTAKCGECGCYMKYNVKFAEFACPLKKWDKDNGNS